MGNEAKLAERSGWFVLVDPPPAVGLKPIWLMPDICLGFCCVFYNLSC